MNKIKTILRVVIFAIIGIVIFWVLTNVLLPKTEYTTIMGEFYQEPTNSLDVIFIGDSSIYRGISPLEIWKKHGITSYNFSSPAQKIWDSYYCLEEALRYQKPKVIVINIETLFENLPMQNGYQRHLFDNMRLSENKINAINDPIQQIDKTRKVSFLITSLRFHDRWKELQDRDFEYSLGQTYHSNAVFKGYWAGNGIKPYQKGKGKKLNNKASNEAIKYLEKIHKVCKENQIQLLLLECPTPKSWNKERHVVVAKWAEQNNVLFLDCNEVEDVIGVNWEKDTYDGGIHLNIEGAEKLTQFIGDFLVQNYRLPNHKYEEKYQSWNEELKTYEEYIKELKEKNKENDTDNKQITRTKWKEIKTKTQKLKNKKNHAKYLTNL